MTISSMIYAVLPLLVVGEAIIHVVSKALGA